MDAEVRRGVIFHDRYRYHRVGRFIDGYLYSCSDSVMGYPLPADLLALSHDKWSLKTVPIIDQPTGMNDPDLIKEGWTAVGLWASFLGISLAIVSRWHRSSGRLYEESSNLSRLGQK